MDITMDNFHLQNEIVSIKLQQKLNSIEEVKTIEDLSKKWKNIINIKKDTAILYYVIDKEKDLYFYIEKK